MIAIFVDAFVKATVLLLLAAGATVLLRRSAAALRHLVWTLACAGVLALPVASAVLPELRLGAYPRLDVPVAFNAEEVDARPAGIETAQPAQPAQHVTAPPAAPAASAQQTRASAESTPVRWLIHADWRLLVFPVWLVGAGLVLVTLAIGLARVTWLGHTAVPVRDPRWLALLNDLTRQLRISQPVRLLQSEGPAMPMTWGVRRPVVLLPADADEWPADQQRDVLLHELAHVKRHDFLIQLCARIACAVYWFHPLVWLAATRLRVERERACDDHVLRAGTKPSAYATHLLEIARALRPAPATSLASVAMARPAQLATRLLDVLDSQRCRDTLSTRSAMPAWLAAIAVVVPLAAAAPSGEVVVQPLSLFGENLVGEVDTIPRVPAPMTTTARAIPSMSVERLQIDTLRGCSGESKHTSSSTRVENEDLTIVTTLGRCTIRLSAMGKFTFNRDFTDFATVSRDGQVVVEVDYGAHDRRVTIRPGDGNTLQRVYKVDGDVTTYDADAKAWLTETITYLLRRTGYQAEERARWILDTRGIQGLVDEFGQLQGDYTRRIYYQAAVESGKLDQAGYERLIGIAAQTISSDYELAELLISVAQTQTLTERMQAGFVAASRTLSSDYERHRVLRAALSRPSLTASLENAMLEAASEMSSDYELATLLIEVNEVRPIDDAVRPAFFKAANSLESDYEHRRVLSAVVSRAGTSKAMLLDVLQSAKALSSDYELAELLTEVSDSYVLDDALRPAYFAAAGTISSDYEHGRSLKSVLDRGEVSREVAVAIVESVKGIASDNTAAEVLIALIRRVRLDDSLQAAVRSAAGGLSSSYERERVLQALARRSGRADLE
jgi:beta-lactamase regulating signal transducer with metallopeptidase domain